MFLFFLPFHTLKTHTNINTESTDNAHEITKNNDALLEVWSNEKRAIEQ